MALVYRDGPLAKSQLLAAAGRRGAGRAVAHEFQAWTESLYIHGAVMSDDRLSDLLNRREPILIAGGVVVPLGTPRAASHALRDIVVDPFDLDFVLAGTRNEPAGASRRERWIHKVGYPVLIAGANYECRGVIHLLPGVSPAHVRYNPGPLFVALTNPVVRRERRIVSDALTEVCLVNRHGIRSLRVIDTLH